MFDLESTCRKLGIWDEQTPKSEESPPAIRAIPAIPIPINSQNSLNSRPATSQTTKQADYHSELEAAKQLYATDAPLSDQDIVEQMICKLMLRDDREFVRQRLGRISINKRLGTMNDYLEQWQQGRDAEPDEIRKDNAGRYRANVWLRERNNAKP
jgi:hypothetical protein